MKKILLAMVLVLCMLVLCSCEFPGMPVGTYVADESADCVLTVVDGETIVLNVNGDEVQVTWTYDDENVMLEMTENDDLYSIVLLTVDDENGGYPCGSASVESTDMDGNVGLYEGTFVTTAKGSWQIAELTLDNDVVIGIAFLFEDGAIQSVMMDHSLLGAFTFNLTQPVEAENEEAAQGMENDPAGSFMAMTDAGEYILELFSDGTFRMAMAADETTAIDGVYTAENGLVTLHSESAMSELELVFSPDGSQLLVNDFVFERQ